MTATTRDITQYLEEILDSANIPDYPTAVNGLQLSNAGQVSKVAAAVDFSARTVAGAVKEEADLLLVHHGMFWPGVRPLTGPVYDRLRLLIASDIAVYSSHLPLDCHPEFGNNALLCERLGLQSSGGFANFKGKAIGLRGESDLPTSVIVDRARELARSHGGEVITTGIDASRKTLSWGVCTGAGASAETLQEATEAGIDTLIVGEGPHWTAVEAADRELAIIYAGHYATETLGVAALAEHLAARFDLGWVMIHAPTGL